METVDGSQKSSPPLARLSRQARKRLAGPVACGECRERHSEHSGSLIYPKEETRNARIGYTRRRKAQKQLAYRLPGRPLLMFLALYVVRLGFMDGRAGLIYCMLRMIYEYMIDLKVKELRRRGKGLPI